MRKDGISQESMVIDVSKGKFGLIRELRCLHVR